MRIGRWARASAVCALTTPLIVLAHLVTAGVAPSVLAVATVGLAVLIVVAVLNPQRRWTTALSVGLAQAAGHALLSGVVFAGSGGTGGCLPLVGRGAELGVRLAFLRERAGCPPGSLAAGPSTTAALATALAAITVLVFHTTLAALTGVLITSGRAAAAFVRAFRTLVLVHVVPARTTIAAPASLTAAPRSVGVWRVAWVPVPTVRRGPPVASAAI